MFMNVGNFSGETRLLLVDKMAELPTGNYHNSWKLLEIWTRREKIDQQDWNDDSYCRGRVFITFCETSLYSMHQYLRFSVKV